MQKAIPVIGVPLVPISPDSLETSITSGNHQTIQPADNSINPNRGLLVSSWERSLNEFQKLAYDAMKKQFQSDPENKIKYKSNKSAKKALFKLRFDYLEQLGLEIIPLGSISEEERERIKTENKQKKLEKKLATKKPDKQPTRPQGAPKQKKQNKKKAPQISQLPIRSLMDVNVQPIYGHPNPQPMMSYPHPQTEKRGYNWREFTGEVHFQPVVDYTRQEEYGSINPLTGYQVPKKDWMSRSWPPTQEQAVASNFADFQASSSIPSTATSSNAESLFPTRIPLYSSQFAPSNSSPFVASDYSPAPSAVPALTGGSGVFQQPVEPQFAMTDMIQAARGYQSQTYQESLAAPQPLPSPRELKDKSRNKEEVESLFDASVSKPAGPSQYAQYFNKVSAPPAPIANPVDAEEEVMRRRLIDIEQQLQEIERQKQESMLAEELRRREMELQQREQWMAMREQELYMREVMTSAQQQRPRSRSRSRDRDRDKRSSHHHDYEAPSSSFRRRHHSPSDRRRPSAYSTRDSREIKIERRDRLREARDAEAARRDGQRSDHRKRFGAAPTRGEDYSKYSNNRSDRIQEALPSHRERSRRRGESPQTEFISDED